MLALVLSACTPDGGSDAVDDEPVEVDAYTETISQCLTTVEPAATGEPLTGEPGDAVTSDPEAGLSYRAFGEPWQPFDFQWSTPELQLTFDGGQKLRAETGGDGTQNWAVVSSTRMPNVVGDAVVTDLGCLGALAVADIIAMTGYRDGAAGTDVIEQGDREVDGRAAWVNITRYKVIDDRFASTSELQGTLLVDTDMGVGVVYVTVPDVRGDLDGVVREVFGSVRVP